MRTTLILDETTMTELRKKAALEKRSLTDIVNETLKVGLGKYRTKDWVCKSYDMGGGFDYSNAWDKIDELEASAVAEKLELRK